MSNGAIMKAITDMNGWLTSVRKGPTDQEATTKMVLLGLRVQGPHIKPSKMRTMWGIELLSWSSHNGTYAPKSDSRGV